MDKKTEGYIDEIKREAPMRDAIYHVTKILKKRVYSLPSGRKLTVILDNDARSGQNQQVSFVRDDRASLPVHDLIKQQGSYQAWPCATFRIY